MQNIMAIPGILTRLLVLDLLCVIALAAGFLGARFSKGDIPRGLSWMLLALSLFGLTERVVRERSGQRRPSVSWSLIGLCGGSLVAGSSIGQLTRRRDEKPLNSEF